MCIKYSKICQVFNLFKFWIAKKKKMFFYIRNKNILKQTIKNINIIKNFPKILSFFCRKWMKKIWYVCFIVAKLAESIQYFRRFLKSCRVFYWCIVSHKVRTHSIDWIVIPFSYAWGHFRWTPTPCRLLMQVT